MFSMMKDHSTNWIIPRYKHSSFLLWKVCNYTYLVDHNFLIQGVVGENIKNRSGKNNRTNKKQQKQDCGSNLVYTTSLSQILRVNMKTSQMRNIMFFLKTSTCMNILLLHWITKNSSKIQDIRLYGEVIAQVYCLSFYLQKQIGVE